LRFDFTARQHVQAARSGDREGADGQQHAQGNRGEGGERKISHQPEQHAAQSSFIAQGEYQTDDRGTTGGNHDTVEQQPLGSPAAAGMGEREHQERRAQRTGSCRPVDDQTAKAQ